MMQLKQELYNQAIKEKFLDLYPEATQVTYKRIFLKSADMETDKGKDLYRFNLAELVEFLATLNPLTSASSRTNGRIVSSYIYWTIEQGLYDGLNPLAPTKPKWYDKFVDEDTQLFVTESELDSIQRRCYNSQDAVLFYLVFEGVMGKECAEIINLRKKDVDFKHNILHLTDSDGSTRALYNVSHKCMKLIDSALQEREYTKRNGVIDDVSGTVRDYTDLVISDYVVRNSITRKDMKPHVDRHTIYRRIDMIKDMLGFPHLTTKNIMRSGMIKMGKELLDIYGKLDREQYEKIADRYNVKNWWRVQEYVNVDTIEKLYGER